MSKQNAATNRCLPPESAKLTEAEMIQTICASLGAEISISKGSMWYVEVIPAYQCFWNLADFPTFAAPTVRGAIAKAYDAMRAVL